MSLNPHLIPYKRILFKTRTAVTTFDNPSMSNSLIFPSQSGKGDTKTEGDELKTYFVQCFSLHGRDIKTFNVVLESEIWIPIQHS